MTKNILAISMLTTVTLSFLPARCTPIPLQKDLGKKTLKKIRKIWRTQPKQSKNKTTATKKENKHKAVVNWGYKCP